MYIPVEKLIDAVAASLREEILPEVGSARARGRLWAVLDVLANLRDRVELKCAAASAETESARDALLACAQALRAAGRAREADRIVESVQATIAAHDGAHERTAAVRALFVEVMKRLSLESDAEISGAARAAIEAHLASQSLRDIIGLKVSPLSEISKG